MGKIHTIKDGKLHIYVRTDKYKGKLKSKNWYGRTYVSGGDKVFSSGTSDFTKAKKILFEKYDELRFQVKHNINVHNSSFKDTLKEYLKDNISIETFVILDRILGFRQDWDNKLSDPVWETVSMRMKKYSPFLNIEVSRYKKILKQVVLR